MKLKNFPSPTSITFPVGWWAVSQDLNTYPNLFPLGKENVLQFTCEEGSFSLHKLRIHLI